MEVRGSGDWILPDQRRVLQRPQGRSEKRGGSRLTPVMCGKRHLHDA
jgi:hypothetical protein